MKAAIAEWRNDMKKSVIGVMLFLLVMAAGASAQDQDYQPQNYIAVNVLHPLLIYTISVELSRTTTSVPVHLAYALALSQNWGISAQFIYRLEIDGAYLMTNEFGFVVGPRFSLDFMKGFFAEFKVGVGYAAGMDYHANDYTRLDLILEPAAGYNIIIGNAFSMTFGLGIQSLIPLTETPARSTAPGGWWDWNVVGYIYHYFLPVFNVSFGLVF
jgi:hypothetical protein